MQTPRGAGRAPTNVRIGHKNRPHYRSTPFFVAEARRLASLIHGPSRRETIAARRALLLRRLSWVTRDGDGSMIWLPQHTWIPTLSAGAYLRLSLADKRENQQY